MVVDFLNLCEPTSTLTCQQNCLPIPDFSRHFPAQNLADFLSYSMPISTFSLILKDSYTSMVRNSLICGL